MPKRAGYHHGDLKAALVECALAVIAERGSAALSVAEVARRLEVSGGAPYRHFPNRHALLTAAATESAHNLTHRFRAVLPGSDPVEEMATAAAVYARFAAETGSGFDLIFAAELRGGGDQDLMEAGRAVMDALLTPALAVTGDAKAALGLIGQTIAASHGYATLWRTGLYIDRCATVDDVALDASGVARILALARQGR